MAFRQWQIGLDIQNGQLCAVGVIRQRGGWQLRHWWQHRLPDDTLNHGTLHTSPLLLAVLRRWCNQLPRRYSLRLGLPPQAVLQRQVELPPGCLHEPGLQHYVKAAAQRAFPVQANELAMDYRSAEGPADTRLCLTAAQRPLLNQWLSCLEEAGLVPDILELTTGALASLGQALALSASEALVHQLDDHWLWYTQGRTGWCQRQSIAELSQLQQHYFPEVPVICFSSSTPHPALPPAAQPLLPFNAIPLLQPPLPVCSGMFTLAAGLALRPEDK